MGGLGGGGGGGGILGGGSGSLFGSNDRNDAAKEAIKKIEELEPTRATDGAPMARVCGRRAPIVPGTVIYQSKINVDTDTEKIGSGKQSSSVTVYRYYITVVIAWGQAFAGTNGTGRINEIRKITANGKNVWSASNPSKGEDRYESLTNYNGGVSQTADPVLEGIFGSGKISGHRDTCCTVIEELDIEDWGNSPPQVWEAILAPDTHSSGSPYLVSQALRDVFLRAPDRTSGEIVTSDVSGANTVRNGDEASIVADGQFEGMRIDGLYSTADVLQTMADAYDLVIRETNGSIRFLDRGDEPVVHVDEGDLGAAEGKAGTDRPFELIPRDHSNLPTEAILQFYAKRNGFRRDSMRKQIGTAGGTSDGVSILSLDLPMVLPQAAARRITKRALYKLRREAFDLRVVLPPRYFLIQETDIVSIPDPDGDERYYVQAAVVTWGANWMIELEGTVLDIRNKADALLDSIPSTITGVIEDDDVDDEDEVENDTEDPDLDDYAPPGMVISIANMPAVTDEEADKIGFFYSQCADDPQAPFKSAQVYKGPTDNGPWKPAGTGKFKHELPLGSIIDSFGVSTPLPVATAPDGLGCDTINHLDVQMLHGTLTAQTIEEFWFAPNYFLIGDDEVIAAKTITPLAPITIEETVDVNTSNQITRGSGDWVADGFLPGHYVRAVTPGNGSFYRRLVSVSTTVLVVAGASLSAESGVDGTFVANEANAYRLTDIYRGLRDTRDHVDSTALTPSLVVAGDRCIPLRPYWLEWIPITKGKVGKAKWMKVVPKGLTLADVPAIPLTVDGETARPFRPAHLHWLWDDTSGDFEPVLRWVHRSRSPEADVTSTTLHELIDETEVYVIEIDTTDDFSTPVRTATVKFTDHDDHRVCAWRYTLAMMTADGFSEGDGFWWRVRQRGTLVQLGNQSVHQEVIDMSLYAPPTGGLAAAQATEG